MLLTAKITQGLAAASFLFLMFRGPGIAAVSELKASDYGPARGGLVARADLDLKKAGREEVVFLHVHVKNVGAPNLSVPYDSDQGSFKIVITRDGQPVPKLAASKIVGSVGSGGIVDLDRGQQVTYNYDLSDVYDFSAIGTYFLKVSYAVRDARNVLLASPESSTASFTIK